MPESRGRRPKPQNLKHQNSRSSRTSPRLEGGGSWKTKIVSALVLLSAIGGLILLVDWAYQIFLATTPEVHSAASDKTNPLASAFDLINRSAYFDMTNIYTSCAAKNLMVGPGQLEITGSHIERRGASHTIKARDHAIIRCPLVSSRLTAHAEMTITVQYRTLGWGRRFVSSPFTWDLLRQEWLEGNTVE